MSEKQWKLKDLEPKWLNFEKGRTGVGLQFNCPGYIGMKLHILFMNPVDGGASRKPDIELPGNNNGIRWARSGMDFESLTISPSIDVPGIWHGHIVDGIVTSV